MGWLVSGGLTWSALLARLDHNLPLVAAAVLALRVGFLFGGGLDLTGDESYYWEWSRRLDWCYYSKPPMVAWLVALATELGGHYPAVVRLPAAVLGALLLWLMHATAKAFYSPEAGALAVLMLLAMPFSVLHNLLMTIDPPLLLFWLLTVYCLHQALFKERLGAWFMAGLATAAAVLSKQVGLLLPLLLLVYLLLDRRPRPGLGRRLGLYLLPVSLALLPILGWNAAHDWVMFAHSKSHFVVQDGVGAAGRLAQAATFVLYQLLLVSPLLFGLVMAAGLGALRRFRQLPPQLSPQSSPQLSPQELLLALLGPVPLFAVMLLAFAQKVQGNWPAPFYLSALVMLSGHCLAGAWRRWARAGILVGLAMVAATYALPVLVGVFNLHNTAIDPTYRFRHWADLAAEVQAARPPPVPGQGPFVLTVGHRFLASQLAFYLPDQPQVFRYEASGQVASQYELWPGPETRLGQDAFIVSEVGVEALPPPLAAVFERVRPLAVVAAPMRQGRHYHVLLGERLRAWPPK